MSKRTLVIGASIKPERYAHQAVMRLRTADHPVEAIGLREGKIADVPIVVGKPSLEDIHTVTLYLNAKRQVDYYDYILGLSPKRIIFNPGAENPELMELATQKGIEALEACTLVMLSIGVF